MPFADELTPDLLRASHAMRLARPWVFLLEVQVDDVNGYYFAANYVGALTFQGKRWDGYPVELGEEKQSSEGSIGSRVARVHNFAFAVSTLLAEGAFVGRQVRILLVHEEYLADPDNYVESAYEVERAVETEGSVEFQLGIVNPTSLPAPNERMDRTYCRFLKEYGAGRCAYDTTLPNLVATEWPTFNPLTCDGSKEGGNGCRAHGANEAANGKAVEHPKRYGGADLPTEVRQ